MPHAASESAASLRHYGERAIIFSSWCCHFSAADAAAYAIDIMFFRAGRARRYLQRLGHNISDAASPGRRL